MLHHNISTISTNIIICWDISIDDWKSLIDTLGSTSFYMLWLPFEGLKDFTFIIYGTDDKSNKLILTSKFDCAPDVGCFLPTTWQTS